MLPLLAVGCLCWRTWLAAVCELVLRGLMTRTAAVMVTALSSRSILLRVPQPRSLQEEEEEDDDEKRQQEQEQQEHRRAGCRYRMHCRRSSGKQQRQGHRQGQGLTWEGRRRQGRRGW